MYIYSYSLILDLVRYGQGITLQAKLQPVPKLKDPPTPKSPGIFSRFSLQRYLSRRTISTHSVGVDSALQEEPEITPAASESAATAPVERALQRQRSGMDRETSPHKRYNVDVYDRYR